jgi:hypothetical protein
VQQIVPELAEYSQPEFQAADLVERVARIRRTAFTFEAEFVGRQLDFGLPDHCFDLGQFLGVATRQYRRPVRGRLRRVTPFGASGCTPGGPEFL